MTPPTTLPTAAMALCVNASPSAAVADCAKDDGWVWTKPHAQIELCGQACLDLKKAGEVQARYFCEAG